MSQQTVFGYMLAEVLGFLVAWAATENLRGAAMLWGGLHVAVAFVVEVVFGMWALSGLIARLAA